MCFNIYFLKFIQGELGEVIAGQKEGRRGDDSVTIYKSLGLAVQDLVRGKSKVVFRPYSHETF